MKVRIPMDQYFYHDPFFFLNDKACHMIMVV